VRFAIDENVPFFIVGELEKRGHDCWSAARDAPAMADEEILPLAVAQRRILVTFDSDFVRLIYGLGMPAPPAIIYMRSRPESAKTVARHFLDTLEAVHDKLDGQLLLINHHLRMRMSALPTTTDPSADGA
jgi:predicted nuclease of predicted toxin-antitoxin system